MRRLLAFVLFVLCALAVPAQRARPRRSSRSSPPATATRRSRPSPRWSPRATRARSPLLQALADGELQVAGKRVLIVQGRCGRRRRHRREGRRRCPPSARTSSPTTALRARARRRAGGAAAGLARSRRAPRRGQGSSRAARRRDAAAGEEGAREGDRSRRSGRCSRSIAATLELDSADKAVRLAAIRTLGDPRSDPSISRCSRRAGEEPGRQLRRARRGRAREARAQPARGRGPPRLGRARSASLFSGVSLGSDPAARRARARHHLRPDGRHQHGARRADHDRRLRHLRRAEPLPRAPARRLRLVPAGRRAGRVRRRRRWSAWRSSARVIRWLYGRPLETLLATWGISLMLIQAVRTIFGAQNVQVENPGVACRAASRCSPTSCCPTAASSSSLFAAAVLVGDVAAADAHAARPLRARRDAEPRDGGLRGRAARRASTRWPSASARASPASPAARSRRSATSARTSASPTSSTRSWWWCWAASGQLAGTVYAALGLGVVNKLLESWSGAVLAKIAVLVFIIVFIQKRPQGLFALKGRAVEA